MMRNALAAIAILLSACSGLSTRAEDFGFRDGHLYTIIDDGVAEYDAGLNLIASVHIPQATVTSGIAFTNAGNLITTIGIVDPVFQIPFQHVVELNSSGDVVRSLNLNVAGFNRGSHIDVDGAGNIYVATREGLVEVVPDFSAFQFLSHSYDRVSGVAIGQDNRLYTTDQETDQLVVLGENREFEQSFDLGNVRSVPIGLDFDSSGELYAALFLDDEIRSVDVGNQATSVFLSGLNEVSDLAFDLNGNLFVSFERGRELIAFDSNLRIIAQSSALPRAVSDSIVVFNSVAVPEPSTSAVWITGAMLLTIRRRRT